MVLGMIVKRERIVMSELLEKQMAFPLMLAHLIIFVYENGYTMTFGEGYDDDNIGHMRNSNHYIKLAQDINLFLDGVFLEKGPEMEKGHGLLHDKWDTLGGAQRISKDLNHYSVLYQGRR